MNVRTASARELSKIQSFGYLGKEQTCGTPNHVAVVAGSVCVDRRAETVSFKDDHDELCELSIDKLVFIGV